MPTIEGGLLEEIGARLAVQNIASSSGDWLLMKSFMPDSTALQNKIVALIETAGEAGGDFTELDRPHFQVTVRGDPITQVSSSYTDTRQKIEDVKLDLHTLGPTLLSGRHYAGIWALQDPFLLEYDNSDRPNLVCNFRALRSRTAQAQPPATMRLVAPAPASVS